jgi:hypothetical protein
MSTKPVRRAVRRIRQSPMNERVWNVEMECGHDQYITRARRPTCTTLVCNDCTYPSNRASTEERDTNG